MAVYVYLDYNATTPLAEEVVQAITYSLTNHWSNPSSTYESGLKAKEAIDIARSQVAGMIGCSHKDIIFTSGGTESNNIVFHSVLAHYQSLKFKPHFITCAIEHDSVLQPLLKLAEDDLIEITVCKPTNGKVLVDELVSAIKINTALVSLMLANNETGVLQPVREVVQAIKKINLDRKFNERILFHTDAAQAIGKISVNVDDLGVDYLSVVGHKFYGPRIGALYVRSLVDGHTPYKHMFRGGNQERGYRPGTENTPMIVGLGKACELVTQNIEKYNVHMSNVRQYLETKLKESFGDDVHFNSHFPCTSILPNTCNISLTDSKHRGWKILSLLEFCTASLGAACHTNEYTNNASKILLLSGISEDIALNAIRLSIGRDTSLSDIDVFVQDLKNAVLKL